MKDRLFLRFLVFALTAAPLTAAATGDGPIAAAGRPALVAAGGAPSLPQARVTEISSPGALIRAESSHGDPARLTIMMTPVAEARIARSPGITVTSITTRGVSWLTPIPATFGVGEGYLTEPFDFKLALHMEPDARIELMIEYAYCPSEDICYFTQATLHIP